MKEKFTEKEKNAAIFRGLFIDKFLKMEYFMEQSIIAFFKVPYAPNTFLLGLRHDETERAKIDLKNIHHQLFFEYHLFSDPFFSTNQKISCFKSILQISKPQFYKDLGSGQYCFFRLLEFLRDFRNILAHNIMTHSDKNQLLAYKITKDFKGENKSIINKEGKTIIENEFKFVPIINQYEINEETKDDIFMQLECIRQFYRLYLYYFHGIDSHLSQKEKESQNHTEVLYSLITSSKVYCNVGVFKLLDKSDQKKAKKPKEKQ